MQFSIYQESRRGARKSNQDRVAYCYSRDALLMLVADGMGGHPRGELAAQIAAQCITEAFRRAARPRLANPRTFLREAFAGAHHAIIRNAEDSGLPESPRTTCVACIVQDGAACWAHAGDSRLYHIRDGRILAQTKDHSLVQQLIDTGRIRKDAAAAHPERSRIFSCLGSERAPRVDLSQETPLEPLDTLILCSDGLWGPLSGRIICSAVQKLGIMQAVPELLDDAEQRAGRDCDNLSVVALTWEGDSQPVGTDQAASPKMSPASADLLPRAAQDAYLSDEEIERAIAEIRNAIKRQTND